MAEIPLPILERIRAEAVAAYPEECCGFLVGRRDAGAPVRVHDAPATPNVAGEESRRREFFVEPRALLRITKELRERDEELVGFYHSHPDHPAELSPTDLRFARLWPRTAWLIVPVEGTEAAALEPPGPRAGRERAWWVPGRSSLPPGSTHERGLDPHDRTHDPGDGAQDPKDPGNLQALKQAIHEMTVRSPGSPGRTSTPLGDRQ